jgi:multiple sugar transport system substrate-binding protein
MSTMLNAATQPSRRAFLKGMTVAAGGALLAACAAPGAPAGGGESMADDSAMEEAVTLRFMAWGDIFGDVLDLYNGANETQVEMAVSPWSGYAEKMLTQFAGGTAPEILWVQAPFFPLLVQRSVFAQLDALIERDGVDVDGLVGSPWVWAGYQGNAYGVPSHGAVPRGLAYNISLFEEAGVELPRYDDWTMDEMDAAVKAIASPPDIWGAAVPPNMIYLDLIMSNGGSLFNEDETQCLLNSDEAREAFTYSVDWLLESGVSPTPGEQQLLGERIFASDKIGMVAAVLTDWDSWGANTQDYALNADMALWPIMPGGKRVSTGQSHPFSIPANTPYVDQAWDFISFYVWDEEAITAMIKKIAIPYKFAENAAKFVDDPVQLDFMTKPFTFGDTFVPEHWGSKPTEVQRAFTSELELMLLGDSSIEQATDNMVEQINAIQAEE